MYIYSCVVWSTVNKEILKLACNVCNNLVDLKLVITKVEPFTRGNFIIAINVYWKFLITLIKLPLKAFNNLQIICVDDSYCRAVAQYHQSIRYMAKLYYTATLETLFGIQLCWSEIILLWPFFRRSKFSLWTYLNYVTN